MASPDESDPATSASRDLALSRHKEPLPVVRVAKSLSKQPSAQRPRRLNPRRRGEEPCPVAILLMPCMAYLYLAMRVRRWLRRRIGRKAGNFLGKLVIIVIGGPPLLYAVLILLLIRLTLKLLSKLDKVRRREA